MGPSLEREGQRASTGCRTRPLLPLPQVMEIFDVDASGGFDAPARWTRTTVLRGANGLPAAPAVIIRQRRPA